MFSLEASPGNMWNFDIEDPNQKFRDCRKKNTKRILHFLKRFQETTKINLAGKCEVILPSKENHLPLYENRKIAESRRYAKEITQ